MKNKIDLLFIVECLIVSGVILGLFLLADFLFLRDNSREEPLPMQLDQEEKLLLKIPTKEKKDEPPSTPALKKENVKKKQRTVEEVKIDILEDKRILTIIWMYDDTPTPPCDYVPNYARACFFGDIDTIYISKEIKGVAKDSILYHEIGHFLYNDIFPKDIFKKSAVASDIEVMANTFAVWMYTKKYADSPKILESMTLVPAEIVKYFENTCSDECIKNILALKIY